MSGVDATAYLAPYATRRVRRPVRLRLTEHSYPLEPSPEQSWLPIAFRAFARIAERMTVHDLLILGTGNGLDALAAAEIFDLRSLTVTDLFAESVAVARANVLAHLEEPAAVELGFLAGDLFSCVPAGKRVDLVYENLPNLPATGQIAAELDLGTHSGRFFASSDRGVPAVFERHLLAMHHVCLREARAHLRAGGGVLTAIGGRVPGEVVRALHRDCGYEPELVAFDVKVQVEPGLVVPGYRRIEEEAGIAFTYYDARAVGLVAEARRAGLEGEALAAAVEVDLRRLAMSATEAERRAVRGEPVAHSVLMVLGRAGEDGEAA